MDYKRAQLSFHAKDILARAPAAEGGRSDPPDGLEALEVRLSKSLEVTLHVSPQDAQKVAALTRGQAAIVDVPTSAVFRVRYTSPKGSDIQTLTGVFVLPAPKTQGQVAAEQKEEVAKGARAKALEECGEADFIRWLAAQDPKRRNVIATPEECAAVLAMRSECVPTAHAMRVLRCTRRELDRWEQEGRIAPVYVGRMSYIQPGGGSGRRWLPFDLAQASKLVDTWREEDRLKQLEELQARSAIARSPRHDPDYVPKRIRRRRPDGPFTVRLGAAFAVVYFQGLEDQHRSAGTTRIVRRGVRYWTIHCSSEELTQIESAATEITDRALVDPDGSAITRAAHVTLNAIARARAVEEERKPESPADPHERLPRVGEDSDHNG